MAVDFFYPAYEVVRNQDRCITCRVCERQCANKVHQYDAELGLMISDESACVNCQRCVSLCPTRALKIVKTDNTFKDNVNYTAQAMTEIYRQAQSGGVLLSAMGNPAPLPVYWDKLLINASQVTNPSIDPLREPMETRVYLGSRPEGIRRDKDGKLIDDTPPQLKLEVPIMFSAMSYGSISYNAHESLARAAEKLGTYYNTGEGGLHQDFYKYGEHTIVQVASGRFGVNHDYLNAGAAIEIKMGQGAKPGIGGHLPGRKIVADIAKTRMIPEGSDAISPAPHHDIYSIEDLRQLVFSLKEASRYTKPVIVKIAAVHNVAAIASGIARSGADIIAIDGFRGGTGAAPTRIRDNVGIPIELALAAVDQRLREEGIRNNVSLIVGGSIRSSADVVKAICLGADAVYIGGEAFGLRAKAKNFSMEDMAEGIQFAHEHGVKVYVTANILAHNGDLEGVREYFTQLKEIKPDALIISDPGIYTIAKEICPEIERHISTQANNTNYGTYQFWWNQGAKRVVTARELSLNEIAEIRKNIPDEMEIETFVHGAMCISYSGRCLLSNYFTGRDANQGACTHPCRWKYAVVEEKRPGEYLPVYENERGTYIFNSKDLCMIEHIPELIEAGIDSFKIEGRMKTALYVATVARTYRKAIDDYLTSPEKYKENMDWYLEQISNCTYRQFTTGFFFGKPSEESQIYDNNTYIKEYTYLGIVGERNEEGLYQIEQRNKFSVGEQIEVMKPDGRNIPVTVKRILDEDGNEMESAPHPKQVLYIDLGQELEMYDILRRQEE